MALMRLSLIAMFMAATVAAWGQAPKGGSPSFATIYDGQVTMIEREVLGLAEKMPADKYDFAPPSGVIPGATFDGVRTYGQQVRHLATTIYDAASSILNEKPPVDTGGPNENGPASMKTKEESIAYLRGALTYAHKAMHSLTAENILQPGGPPYATSSRMSAATFIAQHTYDHYGQMVVYARMNGVIPGGGPAPSAPKGKGKAK
jgi:hypothetical protein